MESGEYVRENCNKLIAELQNQLKYAQIEGVSIKIQWEIFKFENFPTKNTHYEYKNTHCMLLYYSLPFKL